jgi:hypothetical protein
MRSPGGSVMGVDASRLKRWVSGTALRACRMHTFGVRERRSAPSLSGSVRFAQRGVRTRWRSHITALCTPRHGSAKAHCGTGLGRCESKSGAPPLYLRSKVCETYIGFAALGFALARPLRKDGSGVAAATARAFCVR